MGGGGPPFVAASRLRETIKAGGRARSMYQNVTGKGVCAVLCLSCGTSLERIEPESLTRTLSEFVHGYISMPPRIGTP